MEKLCGHLILHVGHESSQPNSGNFSAHSTKQTVEEGRLPRGSANKGPKEQRREERLPSLERQNSSRNEGILPCADSEEDST